jgi:hypothetical protein
MNGTDYSTTDINLAAYLLATDHQLLRLDGPPRQRSFTFGSVTAEDVRRFYAGAPSDARKVLGALRDLKGLIVQGGRP